MPEADAHGEKRFQPEVPVRREALAVKGAAGYDWGMQNRLARIFRPASGRTVMLAFDHGYFQGPTTGLERVDLSIVPLAAQADALMLTRGILARPSPRRIAAASSCGRAAGRASCASSRTSTSRSTWRTPRG